MNLTESFSHLTTLLDNIERNTIISEGGNTFKDEEGNILTQRVDLVDVLPTVRWLESITGLDLVGQERDAAGVPVIWLGSTGRASSSGDLDFAILDASRDQVHQQLMNFINKNNIKAKNQWIKDVKQKEINFRAPIAGDTTKGFVQVDFNFYDDQASGKWAKFYMSGTSPGYKGMIRNVLMSSLAKSLGLKVGANGMFSRTTNELVQNGREPDYVAEVLLGPGHDKADLSTVERIYSALRTDPNRDEKLSDFRGFLEKQGLTEPEIEEPVSEDSSDFLARLRDRIVNQGMEIIVESVNLFPNIVKDILDAVPAAQEIWFHGSRATGKHRKNSDWDILVTVDNTVVGSRYIDIVNELRQLSDKYTNFDIQASHINSYDGSVEYWARKEGKLLWKR